ncbi:hypothetical protein ACFX13_006870 [Malus domestica]
MVKPGSSMGMPSKIKLEEPESSSSSEDLSGGNGADVTFGELQEVRSNGSHVVRDPRFESLCGELDVDRFRKKYRFLFEEELPAEKEELQKQIKKSKDPETIEEPKKHISLIDTQLKSESAKHTEAAILTEHKKKERKAAKERKQPFFLKKSEIRKKRLVEKYKQLKASGKLEAFIEKRRRKNAAKDHRYMPYRGPDATE